jgi:hypothetical protein
MAVTLSLARELLPLRDISGRPRPPSHTAFGLGVIRYTAGGAVSPPSQDWYIWQ